MERVIQVIDDADFRDEMRAKEISDATGVALAQTYPGYRWRVEPRPRHGIVVIRCEMTDASHGYVLKLRNWYSASQWKADVLKAAGEILERSQLNRRAFDESEFRNVKRNFAGRIPIAF